jgi:hypothetical protein
MSKTNRTTIEVHGHSVAIQNRDRQDYTSLTDIARYRNSQEPFAIINNWMRSRSTIEFLGLWEKLCNPDFKPLDFERFRNEADSNYFVLSPQRWIEATQAVGITSKVCDQREASQVIPSYLVNSRILHNACSLSLQPQSLPSRALANSGLAQVSEGTQASPMSQ